MSVLFGRKGALNERLRNVRKELAHVSNHLESLGRVIVREDGAPPRPLEPPIRDRDYIRRPFTASGGGGNGGKRAALGEDTGLTDTTTSSAKIGAGKTQDPRFADYLANSFRSARPLRRERQMQRNRTIVFSLFVLLVLFLFLCRFFRLF